MESEDITTMEAMEEEIKEALLIVLSSMGYDCDTFLAWACDVCNNVRTPTIN